jgi:chemotaxis signal transduction protein
MSTMVLVRVAGRPYAVPTGRVREIALLAALTPVPIAPPRVAGLTQLRGQILPVLALVTDGMYAPKPNDPSSTGIDLGTTSVKLPRLPPVGSPMLVVELGPVRAAIAVDAVEGVGTPPAGTEVVDVGVLFDELRARPE